MAPGARLVVTVPAYQALWSSHDVSHMHHRRYRTGMLTSAAESAGLRTIRTSYFNSTLFPVAATVRLADRARGAKGDVSHLQMSPEVINRPLTEVMRAEGRLIARGRRLPFGLSLLGVFEQPPGA